VAVAAAAVALLGPHQVALALSSFHTQTYTLHQQLRQDRPRSAQAGREVSTTQGLEPFNSQAPPLLLLLLVISPLRVGITLPTLTMRQAAETLH
jgi:hypothetical protein